MTLQVSDPCLPVAGVQLCVTCGGGEIELHQDPPKKGQPLNNGHISDLGTKRMVVVLFSLRKRTISLQRTKSMPLKCPLFRGSSVLGLTV